MRERVGHGSASPVTHGGAALAASRQRTVGGVDRADIDEAQTALIGAEAQRLNDLRIVGVSAREPDRAIALRMKYIQQVHDAGGAREQLLEFGNLVWREDSCA